jgi:hypothetical protein
MKVVISCLNISQDLTSIGCAKQSLEHMTLVISLWLQSYKSFDAERTLSLQRNIIDTKRRDAARQSVVSSLEYWYNVLIATLNSLLEYLSYDAEK